MIVDADIRAVGKALFQAENTGATNPSDFTTVP